jgi:hypothetical protein
LKRKFPVFPEISERERKREREPESAPDVAETEAADDDDDLLQRLGLYGRENFEC